MSDSPESWRERYERLAKAMQTCCKFLGNSGIAQDQTPPMLRTGVNMAMCDSGALIELLVKKGVISEDEIMHAICDMAERDLEAYRELIRQKTGSDTTINFL